jgi:hypothetical protein
MTKDQGQEFEELRTKEMAGDLPPEENARLKQLTDLVVADEAAQLALATEALRRRRNYILVQTRSLRKLERGQLALARQLERFLDHVRSERESISEERASILKDSGLAAPR